LGNEEAAELEEEPHPENSFDRVQEQDGTDESLRTEEYLETLQENFD